MMTLKAVMNLTWILKSRRCQTVGLKVDLVVPVEALPCLSHHRLMGGLILVDSWVEKGR